MTEFILVNRPIFGQSWFGLKRANC
jgi:hypothetical protein